VAKALDPMSAGGQGATTSPTITSSAMMTGMDVILGTDVAGDLFTGKGDALGAQLKHLRRVDHAVHEIRLHAGIKEGTRVLEKHVQNTSPGWRGVEDFT
jgi:hypothetical protein